jgi:hypothetical protein
MNEEKEKTQRRKGILLWLFIGILMVSNGITIWLLLQKKNEIGQVKTVTEKIIVERDNIQTDLENLKKEYETLQTSDAAMQMDIEQKKGRIDSLLQQAAKHRGDAYIMAQLKKETETLRTIMMGYVRTIDSLNTLNQTLVAEKKTVLKQLGVEKEKQVTLIREKDELKSTIEKGSILTCFNISAKAVGYRRGGKKEVETSRSRKTEKIKVTFSLGENKIAKPGPKTVFVRVMTPDGKEMAKGYDENYKFVFNKSVGYWAAKETLNYANTEITGVTYCEGQGDYIPGTYMIEIVCDNVVIGSSTLKLD